MTTNLLGEERKEARILTQSIKKKFVRVTKMSTALSTQGVTYNKLTGQ